MRIRLGGHRGLGCTDHDFYQDKRDIANLPSENTAESIAAAFAAGADYIETDAVMSTDGELFVLHNVVPADHFFAKNPPPALLNTLDFSEIEKHPAGRAETGRIAKLSDILNIVADKAPKSGRFDINVEIKGVQGSGQPFETNDFIDRIAEVITRGGVPVERVLFSSFSLQNSLAMSHRLPGAQYGLLLTEKTQRTNIYADHHGDPGYQYLPFTSQDVDDALTLWHDAAHPTARISYAHPEVATITEQMLDQVKAHGLDINSWAVFEGLNAERKAVYQDLIRKCDEKGIGLTIMTDYLEAMRHLQKKPAGIDI